MPEPRVDSRDAVKATLEAAFEANRNEGTVVSLTGAWGSGKTHLWREVAVGLRKEARSTAYVSLFGLTSIAEVRAALVNEAVLSSGGGEESKVKQLIGSAMKQLPGVLQALDKKIGFELLSKNIDLTRLVPKGAVVCLDDLERIPDSMRVEDVLGFAGFLAEMRGASVLLIMNEAHMQERSSQYATYLRAYRERVIRLSLRLEPDISSILLKSSLASRFNVSPSIRERFSRLACRSKLTNIRTLVRALERVELLARVTGSVLCECHVDFLLALTVEEAEGALKPFSYYDFHPAVFVFERHVSVAVDEQHSYRQRFFFRYYDVASEYSPSEAVYGYVVNGYPDVAEFVREREVRLAADRPTAVQDALRVWVENKYYYYSDAELRLWRSVLVDALSGSEALRARQYVECVTAIALSSEMLGEELSPSVGQAAADRLVSAASAGDDSLEQDVRYGLGSHISSAMVAAYKEALERARSEAARDRLLDAVRARDMDLFRRASASDVPHSLVAVLGEPVVGELTLLLSSARDFYIDALRCIGEGAKHGVAPGALVLLVDYANAQLARSDIDASDRWRLRGIVRDYSGSNGEVADHVEPSDDVEPL